MKKILLFICLIGSAFLVRGQDLDQQQGGRNDTFYPSGSWGQTFTAGKSGALGKITVYLRYGGNMTVKLYNTDANGLPILNNVLATGTGFSQNYENSVDFVFSTPYSIVSGTKYAFVIGGTYVFGTASNFYSGGAFFDVNSSNIATINTAQDCYFKTYIYRITTTTIAATCNGASNGSATATPIFGTAPYTYSWSNGATTATASNLVGGDYTVTVKDVNNVSYQQTVTVGQPAVVPQVFSATVTPQIGPFCDNKGSLTITNPQPVILLGPSFQPELINFGGNTHTLIADNSEVVFTDDNQNQKGYVFFNSLLTQPTAFTAKFKFKGVKTNGADGFSFSYGELNTGTTDTYENGLLKKDANNKDIGLVIKFLTFNQDRIQIWYNGVQYGSEVNTTIEDGNFHNYEVTVNASNQITLKRDNAALFTNVTLTGFATTVNYQLAFAARTGGSSNQYSMNNAPSFTDNTTYQYSLNGYDWSADAQSPGYFDNVSAGSQKVFARLPGMTCGGLLGTYNVPGTPPAAAPVVTSPQTFPNGNKVSAIVVAAAPTGFYVQYSSDADAQTGVSPNATLQSGTYYVYYRSTDGLCTGSRSAVVINVDNIPTIDKIATVDVCSSNTADVAVKLTDENVNALTLTAVSSDTNILPNSGLTISGTGANRTVKITPTNNVSGIVTVTLTTKDLNNTTVLTFVVRIVNVSTLAEVKIFAGNGNSSVVADNVLPTATHLVNPKYVDVDKAGNVFIGESQKVRRIDKATGKITTIATTTGTTEIKGITVDKAGNVFYTDGATIYKLTAGAGTAVKYAGSTNGTQVTDNNGVANANIGEIQFMYIDNFDNIYVVTDGGARIRLILPDTNKTLRDAAGTGVAGYDDDGALATNTKLSGITGLTKDANGNIYFTVSTFVDNNPRNAVRKVAESGKRISTVFSSYPQQTGPNPPTYSYPVSSSFYNCRGIDIDANNNLYVAQEYNIIQLYGTNYSEILTLMGSAREIPDNSPYGFMGVAYDSSTDLLLLPAYQTSGNGIEQSQRVYRYVPAIYVTCNTVLPVTLTNFTAKAEGNKSKIEWTTASEQNNKSFEVQRSADGINFITVTTVKGNGNSNATNRYSAFDTQPLSGVNYYRLKQIDTDGKETIASAIKSVSFNFEDLVGAKLFPNPADDVVNISVTNYKDMQLNVDIIDVNGKIVHHEVIVTKVSALSYKLNLGKKLTPGYYSVKLSGINYNTVLKLIVH